jgi:protein-S-isoprenylcysteine O-methyltransferase Ste14
VTSTGGDKRWSRDGAAVRVFPPAVPLIAILAGSGLQYVWPIDVGMAIPALVRYWIGGAIFAGAVLLLGGWSVLIMRRSGQSENPWKPTTEIIERGPYRFTRNPMYLQMVIACVGVAVAFGNVWILLLAPVCAWALQVLAILPEEEYLERKFGDRYLTYKRRVRRWL